MAFLGFGNTKDINYQVNLLDKTEGTRQKLQKGFGDLDKSAQGAAGGGNMFASAIGNIGTVAGGVIAANVLTSLVQGTKDFLGASINASNELSRALTTLEIVAPRFGVNADEAKKAAQELGQELRIGVGPAASTLQNLLKSGLNLEQAKELMKRFTNEAITGKSSTITLAQAVENLSFSFATENSALGNLSGISENYNKLLERGAELMGKSVNELTDSERAQAKYKAMIELTNLTMGSAEKFTGTLIDKQAELDLKMQELQASVGEKLNPVIAKMVDLFAKFIDEHGDQLVELISILIERFGMILEGIIPVVEWISRWIDENPELAKTLADVITVIAGLLILGQIIALLGGAVGGVMSLVGAFGSLVGAIPGVTAGLAGLTAAGGPILAIAAVSAIAVIAVGKLIYELKRLADAEAAAAESAAVRAKTGADLSDKRLKVAEELRKRGYQGKVGGLSAKELGQLAGQYGIDPKKLAAGGDFVTNGPQMIMVGDNFGGRERVRVEPLSSPNYSGSSAGGISIGNLHVSLPNVSNAQQFMRELRRLMADENLSTRLGANRAL